MRRHFSLRELSVDHHHALVQAHRLIKAAETDNAIQSDNAAQSNSATQHQAATAFLHFWYEQANLHFREEEEVLLPYFARYGNVDQPAINQMLREHVLIRCYAGKLEEQVRRSTVPADLMHRLGAQLEAHVRLEERVVFPLIEVALNEEQLAELANKLSKKGNRDG